MATRTQGVALALSGGGFRATLFHLGSLWRLNELGWLPRLTRVTSVSGGSITAAYLALRWKDLSWDQSGRAINLTDVVIEPLRAFCRRNVQARAIGRSVLTLSHPARALARVYDGALFRGATLRDLPAPGAGPEFILYATSLQSGVSVRMSRRYLADYRVGRIVDPILSLAQAVAASSGFPPVFAPLALDMTKAAWSAFPPRPGAQPDTLLDAGGYRSLLYLADGGVYDNLGLEAAWDDFTTVLVSDAGAPYAAVPKGWWRVSRISLMMRVLWTIDRQNRALRKRWLIDRLQRGEMAGAYWGVATQIGDYRLAPSGLADAICQDSNATRELAQIRTSLDPFSTREQGELINWGYALTDAAMRRHVLQPDTSPGTQPIADYRL